MTGNLSTLEIGNALNINNGGKFDTGANGDSCTITKYSTTPYAFNVESGGTIDASSTTFEYMDASGINVKSGATIDTTSLFQNCIFTKGESGGTLLTIDNNQTLAMNSITFNADSKGAAYNVTKNVNSGSITFASTGGTLNGPEYENDPYGKIIWSGYFADLQISNTLWSNQNPYIGDEISVDVTITNNGTDVSSLCDLELFYNPVSPPSVGDTGDKSVSIAALGIGDSDTFTISNIPSEVAETWSSYLVIDADDDVTESDETNNVYGPDTITWQPLPVIDDLSINYNAGNIELSWTYPVSVDRFKIYKSENPEDFSGASVITTTETTYTEAASGSIYFYRVTAERDIIVK